MHLVDTHAGTLRPPPTIEFGRGISAITAAVLWILLAAAAVGTALLIAALWTSDTPGWWFNLIFTALPALFLTGCAYALVDSRRSTHLHRRLSAQWTATHSNARPTTARIVDRDVQLMEHGSVSSFTLTAETEDGQRIRARWYRSSPANSDATLLQPQVPAIGSTVRIWATPDASPDDPHVVEALDPSITRTTPTP